MLIYIAAVAMAGDTVAIGKKEGVRWLPPDVAGPL